MNHNINYIKLYNYFREKDFSSKYSDKKNGTGLTAAEAFRNIWRTRNLPKDFKEVIYQILEGNAKSIADFEIEGVSIRQLHLEEGLNLIQAVFFLDWLRREPANARAYMSSRRYRDTFQIDKDKKQKIQEALDKWKKKTGKDVKASLVPEDRSKNDIEVEIESEQTEVMTSEQLQDSSPMQQHPSESVAGEK